MTLGAEFILTSFMECFIFFMTMKKIPMLKLDIHYKLSLIVSPLLFFSFNLYKLYSTEININLYFIIISFTYLILRYQNSIYDCILVVFNYYILFFYTDQLLNDLYTYIPTNIHNHLGTLYKIFFLTITYILFSNWISQILNYLSYIDNKNQIYFLFFNIVILICISTNNTILLRLGEYIEILFIIKISFLNITHEKQKTKKLIEENKTLHNKYEFLIKQNQLNNYHTYQKIYHNLYKINTHYKKLIHEYDILSNYYILPDETQKYIDKIKKSEIIKQNKFHTGIDILDILLEEKLVEAQKKGIKLKITGNLNEPFPLEPISLSLIFDNLINVILDTAQNIQIRNKSILVSFQQKYNNNLSISIKPILGKIYK